MRHPRISVCIPLSALLLGPPSLAQTPGSPSQKAPVAIIGGQQIFESDILPAIEAQIFQLRLQEFDAKSKALENLINQKLLEAGAAKKGLPAEKFLAQEVDAAVPEPTEAELRALWIVQKEQLQRTFEEIKPQLSRLLKQSKLQEARQQYYSRLRQQAGVTILLKKPKAEVAADPSRLRGDPKAALTIIEFSDFQCPHCRAVQPTLKAVLAKYAGRVSLSYRDFPLREIHPQAQSAAEAARCAGEQGRFWEFHDLLIDNPNKLSRQGFIEHAGALKLDASQFEACLSSGKFQTSIEQDRQLGMRAGVNGTPGFVINGNVFSGNLPVSSFERAIDAELAALKPQR